MRLGAVILAAGAGARLGGRAKAMLRAGEETYLARITRIAHLSGVSETVVVVGPPFGATVGALARNLGHSVIINAHPERGMASSVALGFGAMQIFDVEAAWLWPVDHGQVQLATLERLIGAMGDHDVAQPRLGDRGGHPPLIARRLFSKLAACGTSPDGARSVLRAANVIQVPVDDVGVIRDVDTPADLVEIV